MESFSGSGTRPAMEKFRVLVAKLEKEGLGSVPIQVFADHTYARGEDVCVLL